MDIDTKTASQRLYTAAAIAMAISLTSWMCCAVGPLAGIGAGIYARRQARWTVALMEEEDVPHAAVKAANVAGAVAVVLSVLELVVLFGLRFLVD